MIETACKQITIKYMLIQHNSVLLTTLRILRIIVNKQTFEAQDIASFVSDRRRRSCCHDGGSARVESIDER